MPTVTFLVIKKGIYTQGVFGPFCTPELAKAAAQGHADGDSDSYHDWEVCSVSPEGLGEPIASYRHNDRRPTSDYMLSRQPG